MKSRRLSKIVLAPVVLAFLACFSCGGPSGISGPTGEWLKGNAVSCKVTFLSFGSGSSFPSIEIRNDSGAPVSMSPVKVVIWYSDAGRKEFAFRLTQGDSDAPASLAANEHVTLSNFYGEGFISGRVAVQLAESNVREIAVAPAGKAPSVEGMNSVKKARLILGADASPAQEIFTASTK